MAASQHEDVMTKRASLFKVRPSVIDAVEQAPQTTESDRGGSVSKRPPSRAGKRVLSIYLDPLAWKQLRQLALDTESTTQALGEEAINLLFAKHGLNRSA
jgi:antitoxin-like ribbon-helix-helix protein